MSRRFTAIGALIAIVLALVASCGVPQDESPTAISANAIPEDLRPNTAPTPTPTVSATNSNRQIYMVGDDDLLTPVGRSIEATPTSVLDSLLLGASPDERTLGIDSAISRDTDYLSISVDEEARIAYVDLTAGSLRRIVSNEQRIAFGQIVYSLTDLPDIEQVVFSIAGVNLAIQADGGLTEAGQAVGKAEFASLDDRAPRIAFPDDEFDDGAPATPVPVPLPTEIERPLADLVPVSVWMVSQERNLIPVERRIERIEEALLNALLAGATPEERSIGIVSALTSDALAISIDVDESLNIALVDLAEASLPGIEDNQRLLAVGQIVYTLTEFIEIDGVTISLGGVRVPMPTERGLTRNGGEVLTRNDFTSLAPSFAPVATPGVEFTPTPTPG